MLWCLDKVTDIANCASVPTPTERMREESWKVADVKVGGDKLSSPVKTVMM